MTSRAFFDTFFATLPFGNLEGRVRSANGPRIRDFQTGKGSLYAFCSSQSLDECGEFGAFLDDLLDKEEASVLESFT